MILGVEIALLIVGIVALCTGKLPLTKLRAVYGVPARLLALICLMPLPVAFLCGWVFGYTYYASGGHEPLDSFRLQLTLLEGSIVAVFVVLLYSCGWPLSEQAPPKDSRKDDRGRRRPPRDDERGDWDDRRDRERDYRERDYRDRDSRERDYRDRD